MEWRIESKRSNVSPDGEDDGVAEFSKLHQVTIASFPIEDEKRLLFGSELSKNVEGQIRFSGPGHAVDHDVLDPLVLPKAKVAVRPAVRIDHGSKTILTSAFAGWRRIKKDTFAEVLLDVLKQKDAEKIVGFLSLQRIAGDVEEPLEVGVTVNGRQFAKLFLYIAGYHATSGIW